MKNIETQEQKNQKKAKRQAFVKKAAIAGIGLGAIALGVHFAKKAGASHDVADVDLYPKTPLRKLFDPDTNPDFMAGKVTDNMGRTFTGHWFDPGEKSNEYMFFTTKEYESE